MNKEIPSKALTIRAPWAQAIVHGPKRIENRTWKPPSSLVGSRLAIHVSSTPAKIDDYGDERTREQFEKAHLYMVGEGVTEIGSIIGTAEVNGW